MDGFLAALRGKHLLPQLIAAVLLFSCGGEEDEGPPADPNAPPTAGEIQTSVSQVELDALGAKAQIVATVLDEEGFELEGIPLTWSSSAPAVAEVDKDGVVTARENGEATVSVRALGVTATVEVKVEQVARILVLQPKRVVFDAIGAAQELSAEVLDAGDHPVAAPIEWRSVDPDIATVDEQGRVVAHKAGKTEIAATVAGGELLGTVDVEVAPVPVRSGLRILVPPQFVSEAPTKVEVQITDREGHPVENGDFSVTLALGENPAGGRLSGTLTAKAVKGVAAFPGLRIDKAAPGYTLVAQATGLDLGESVPFDVVPGSAARLQLLSQPSRVVSLQPFSPALRFEVVDGAGNRVSGTQEVQLTLAKGADAVLGGTTTVRAVGGIASFDKIHLDRAGRGYVLRASATGLEAAESGAIEVAPGLASQLAFLVEPSSTSAGKTLAPAVQVEVLDEAGNRVENDARSVSVVLAPHASGAQLAGTNTQTTVNGVAAFADLVVDRAGNGMVLVAGSPGMEEVSSLPFDVGAGAPARLVFHLQPGNSVSGAPLPSFEVRAVDATGTFTPEASGVVSIAQGQGPEDAQLSGARTVALQNGKAVFSDVRIDKAGTGYTLYATADGLSRGESSPFRVDAGSPASLAFLTQPAGVGSLLPMVPAPQVEILDAAGNRTTSTSTVSLQLANNPWGGSLTGSTTVAAVDGVATFSNLRVNRAGTDYRLVASAGALTGPPSAAFAVTAGEPQQLAFRVSPANVEAGVPFSPALEVEVQDAAGNPVSSSGQTIRISLAENPGGATLSGSTQSLTENGVALFPNLSLDRVSAEGYVLLAEAEGLGEVRSAAFFVRAGQPAALSFHQQPADGVSGQALPEVEVRLLDAKGNWNQSAGGTVTLTLDPNPTGATLAGDRSVPVDQGRALFSNLRIEKAGSGYGFRATSGTLQAAVSETFQVAPGQPVGLAFVGSPGSAVSNEPIPAVQVEVRDAAGNRVRGATHSITVARSRGPAATLSGETTVDAVDGMATFDDLRLDVAGSGYALQATSGAWASPESGLFSVAPGPGSKLRFRVHPGPGSVGIALSPAVEVEVLDAAGNRTAEDGHEVRLAIAAGPEGASLAGATSALTQGGVATFSSLFLDKAGGGYRLGADADGMAGDTSNAFSIAPGSGNRLDFLVQPVDGQSGTALSEVQVRVLDEGGNPTGNASGTVTISLAENPTNATLGGVTSASLVDGVASFKNLVVDKQGSGYALRASSDTYATATSGVFSISPGSPAKLQFVGVPSVVTSGQPFLEAVLVEVVDAAGNRTGANTAVQLSLDQKPRPDSLEGTLTQQATNGLASFPGLKLHLAAKGYTLRAEADGLDAGLSPEIEVVAGPADRIAFVEDPQDGVAGQALPTVRVEFLDAAGNRVEGRADEVSLGLASGPGTLSGVRNVAAQEGVADFEQLFIERVGTYSLVATGGGMTSSESEAFTVSAASAHQLAFLVQPSDTYPDFAIRPEVEVEVQDRYGNRVPTADDPVTITLENNPTGATLGGNPVVNAINGVAPFGNLKLDKLGAGYTFRASSGALESAESVIFDVVQSKATSLAFVTQPQHTPAGELLNPIQVEILDENEMRLDASLPISISLASAPEGGTLGGTLTVYAVNGLATFSNLAITKTGPGYSLKAHLNELVAFSEIFDILSGAPKGVVWTQPPRDTVSGQVIFGETQNYVGVEIVDMFGERVTNYNGEVTISVGAGPTGAYLQGFLTTTAAAGMALFPGLSIDRAGTYRLLVLPEDVPPSLSPSFEVVPGTATRMRFLDTLSGSFVAGETLPPLRVAIEDAAGNRTDSSQDLTLKALGGAGNVQLEGNPTLGATNGLVTFDDISILQAGGYHLAVEGFGLSPVNGSGVFIIEAGEPAHLSFARQPAGGKAKAELPPVEVVLLDEHGNQTTGTQEVTLVLVGGSAGAELTGSTTRPAANGKVVFDDLVVSAAGTGYRLKASTTGDVPSLTSSEFEVFGGVPHSLQWSELPVAGVSDEDLNPQVVVRVVDEFGETVESFDGTVEIAIASGPAGGTLDGTLQANAEAGVATFEALRLDRVGTYTLRAEVPALAGVPPLLSAPVSIIASSPAHLVFQSGPFNTRSLQSMAAVEVAILDAAGNLVEDAEEQVVLRLEGVDAPGAILFNETATPVEGIASFDALQVDKVGSYMLIASIGALDSLPSREFRIQPGDAHSVRFVEEPQDHRIGNEFSAAVRFYDEAGNEAQGNHVVSLKLHGGAPGALLEGQSSKAASDGIASFDSLRVDEMGEGYFLEAEASDLEPDTSDTFRVMSGDPVAFLWLGTPADSQAGDNLGPLQFEVVDAYLNRVVDYEESLSLSLVGPGGSLEGDTEPSFEAGLATAANLFVRQAGIGYQIVAETVDFGPVASAPFNIVPGPVDRLEFVSSPDGGFAGTTLQKVVVAAVDEFDNPVAESIDVSIALAGGEPEAALVGTLVRPTVSGLATFDNLSIDKEGEEYELIAQAAGVDEVTSAPFAILTGCEGGLQRCGDACVDTMSDEAHCGVCDQACEGDATCKAGSCTLECEAGMDVCSGFCVDLQSDPSSCGSCGQECDEGEMCLSGQCVIEPDWQVANWPLPAEMPHRYDVGELTVLDQVTGLSWQRQAPITQANRASAASYCANLKLGGKDDWRLPTVIELLTLVDASRVWPSFGSVFPDQVGASWSSSVRGYFWTNTPRAGSNHYWIVNFETGGAGSTAVTDWHWVRCVRGGSGNNAERYSIANHIVRDNKTRLTWQRRAFAGTFTQEEADQACSELNLEGYTDWRLPTKLELESLVDWRWAAPSIDSEAFLDTLNEDYWTSTAYPLHALENYWRVSFNTGASGASPPDRKIRLRCVRDDEPPVQVCGERGQAPCGGVCVSIWDDPANCGACGNVCDAGLFCSDGRCSEEPNFEWATWEIPPELSSEYDEGLDTVRDRITGLVWQRSGTNLVLSLQDAKAYCKNLRLEQKTDWRLPSAIELLSIVDATAGSAPYINRSAFQNTYSGRYWTMSRRSRSDSYWFVDFAGASSGTAGVTTQYYVRCVRGGTPVPPGERYIIDDDVVYDIYTKLTWQRFPTTAGMTRTQANAYCTNLTFLGHRDWRLPTKKELESLVDRRRIDPGTAIDWLAFPGTVHWNYWAEGPTSGWRGYVAFSSGGSGLTDTTSSSHYYPVRCVRDDKQPPPACGEGETLCDNSCVDVQTDHWHCGACGNVCADDEACSAGSCIKVDHHRAKWTLPPDDPVYNPDNPALSDYYVDPENPTVILDVHTGLTWQRTQTVRAMSQPQAALYCRSLAHGGYSDWRLPTLVELISIQTRARRWPALNTSAFTSAPTGSGDHWWSSTPTAWDPNIYQVAHSDGGNGYIDRNSAAWVRCVRGGSIADAQPWQVHDHYAVDPNTGLMWARNYSGTYNNANAENFCTQFEPEPGLTGWRLPTRKEIHSFTDYKRVDPAFDPDIFGAYLASSYFWTSSVWVGDSNQRWRLTFSGGTGGTVSRNTSTNMYVRCVRELSP